MHIDWRSRLSAMPSQSRHIHLPPYSIHIVSSIWSIPSFWLWLNVMQIYRTISHVGEISQSNSVPFRKQNLTLAGAVLCCAVLCCAGGAFVAEILYKYKLYSTDWTVQCIWASKRRADGGKRRVWDIQRSFGWQVKMGGVEEERRRKGYPAVDWLILARPQAREGHWMVE